MEVPLLQESPFPYTQKFLVVPLKRSYILKKNLQLKFDILVDTGH